MYVCMYVSNNVTSCSKPEDVRKMLAGVVKRRVRIVKWRVVQSKSARGESNGASTQRHGWPGSPTALADEGRP